jgi:hypothetical protein
LQETDSPRHCGAEFRMETKADPRVVVADRAMEACLSNSAMGRARFIRRLCCTKSCPKPNR